MGLIGSSLKTKTNLYSGIRVIANEAILPALLIATVVFNLPYIIRTSQVIWLHAEARFSNSEKIHDATD
jgi:hypothetical protein